jgi:hypothetical protein
MLWVGFVGQDFFQGGKVDIQKNGKIDQEFMGMQSAKQDKTGVKPDST